jgi:deferrochelatase/peroxidase EfeB
VAGAALPASAAQAAGRGAAVPFFGAHQQGIATPQQSALMLAAFDLPALNLLSLRSLLQRWSGAAERMTRGLPPMAQGSYALQPPPDSGETAGLTPGRLTITFGLGPRIFSLPGMGAKRPPGFRALPSFPTDRLDPGLSGGDLVVQACAEDPTIAFHAVRMLHTLSNGARLRWTQRGFLPSAYRREETPRNLMGLKDGTLNPRPGSRGFADAVWVSPSDSPGWLRDGSYMVFRRIQMNLARWDSSTLSSQEATIGRHRLSGAPLGARAEHDPLNLSARTASGALVIPPRAHVRLAHPSLNNGVQIMRRSYSYDDGVTEMRRINEDVPSSHGVEFDAGLAFIAFMRSPSQFITLQNRLSGQDKLNDYITHVGSGLFVIPPGAAPAGYVGQTLLG